MKLTKVFDRRFEGTHTQRFEALGRVRVVARVADLYQSVTNPGYSVSVIAEVDGRQVYSERSSAFTNRSAKDARETRSSYMAKAREAVRVALSHQDQTI